MAWRPDQGQTTQLPYEATTEMNTSKILPKKGILKKKIINSCKPHQL